MKLILLALVLLTACGSEELKPTKAPPPPPPLSATAIMPPVPPQVGTASIGVCWDYNDDPNLHYTVFANEKPGRARPALQTKVTTTNSVTFDGLFHGKAYFFFVTASNDQGIESEPSDEIGYKIPTMGIRADANAVYVKTTRPMPGSPNVTYRLMATKGFDEWTEVLAVEKRLSLVDGVETIEYTVPHTEQYLFFKIFVDVEPKGCNP